MAKPITVKTGEKAPVSGIYKPSGSTHEITLDQGEKVPPNNEGKRPFFTLVRATKHKK